jgi:DNA-binding MarR family transcriptional regulator
MSFTQRELKGFAAAAHSLKLYRRADLRDDVSDKSLIGKLYVDPLQNDAVLDTMLRESTTFLIGRKGTGKSTVFQRAQHELRTRSNVISAYVDIKTVFESADVDPTLPAQLEKLGTSLGADTLKKVLLYRAFIRTIFNDIKIELKSQIGPTSIFGHILNRLGLQRSEIIGQLDELLEGSFEAQLTDVTAFKQSSYREGREQSLTDKFSAEAHGDGSISLSSTNVSLGGKLSSDSTNVSNKTRSEEYSAVIIRTFNLTKIIEDLRSVLNRIGIKRLYVFIDDFSELPEEAMHIFVDTVLAPLNNWSSELIKFKIAAYPGRIYLGDIDLTKIDQIYIDLFKLYGDCDVSTMEDKSTDFTRRLIDSRFRHYVCKRFSYFCDSDHDAVFRQLFYASMANPRMLGHILTNIRDSVTTYHKPIGARAVQDASVKYYEEKIEPFFGTQKFAHESFSERASIFSLKELLEGIVARARTLRDYKGSRVTRDVSGRTPSSHFHIAKSLDASLATLELNFFLTSYYEMKDRDGKDVSVYAINHGLCNKYTLSFGRPSGQREHRLYFVERIFDYTSIVRRFLESNQEIKCDHCGTIFGLDMLDTLVIYEMLCPRCKKGVCKVTNLSKKYENVIRSVDPSLMLPATELGILETLYTEKRQMVASEIAGELDISYQLVGKRGINLEHRGLVFRRLNDASRRVLEITEEARRDYFEGNAERRLDLESETRS